MDDQLENVILVTADNTAIGQAKKLDAHRRGLLHRAFSVFLFDTDGKWVLQKRAQHKYHSGGLWANACCGHPRPGEDIKDAAERRLYEEIGLRETLAPRLTTQYSCALDNGMHEHEVVTLFTGWLRQSPRLNPREASHWAAEHPDDVKIKVKKYPDHYAYWLRFYVETHYADLCHPAWP